MVSLIGCFFVVFITYLLKVIFIDTQYTLQQCVEFAFIVKFYYCNHLMLTKKSRPSSLLESSLFVVTCISILWSYSESVALTCSSSLPGKPPFLLRTRHGLYMFWAIVIKKSNYKSTTIKHYLKWIQIVYQGVHI